MLPIVISIPIRFPIVRVEAGLITIVKRKLYCWRIWILCCIKTTFSLTSPIIIRLRHENPFPQWIMLGCRVGWMCSKEGYHKYFSLNFHLLEIIWNQPTYLKEWQWMKIPCISSWAKTPANFFDVIAKWATNTITNVFIFSPWLISCCVSIKMALIKDKYTHEY